MPPGPASITGSSSGLPFISYSLSIPFDWPPTTTIDRVWVLRFSTQLELGFLNVWLGMLSIINCVLKTLHLKMMKIQVVVLTCRITDGPLMAGWQLNRKINHQERAFCFTFLPFWILADLVLHFHILADKLYNCQLPAMFKQSRVIIELLHVW